MDKSTVDRLISQYQKNIFGFALNKLRNYSQAEELASDISCQVYLSFLRADNIPNPDGYVYRVASNVFANYVAKQKGTSFEDISDMNLPCFDDTQYKIEQDETIKRLRSEIGYLTQRQRTIVYLYYYQKLTAAKIAERLDISAGTVKWHLSDARSALKEGIEMTNYTENTAVNPIKFTSMGHDGSPGEKGDTSNMFDTRLKQNIAYACYWESKTAEEIARTIGVPLIYVQDELKILEEYGYIDRMDNSAKPKFLTNMYITDERLFDDTESRMRREAAEFLCDKLYRKILADFDSSPDNWGLACSDNDKNFLKYSLIMLCQRFLFNIYSEKEIESRYEKFSVKRPDGGNFIAHATVSDDCRSSGNNAYSQCDPYWCCGYMTRDGDGNVLSVSIDCCFTDREGWRENRNEDWAYLYRFIKKGKSALSPEEYKRLCDKGYILNDKVMVTTYKTENSDKLSALKNINTQRISLPEEIVSYANEYDRKIYMINKPKFPKHMQELVKAYSSNSFLSAAFIPHIIDILLKSGDLAPLSDEQKKSALSVLVCD